jgi:hypothetical protein
MTTSKLLMALGVFVCCGSAQADPILGEGVSLAVGVFAVYTDSEIRVDDALIDGDHLDVEQHLGLEDEQRLRIDLDWRFAPRHKLRVMWFANDRVASNTLTANAVIDGVTYSAGVNLTTSMSADVLELVYEYSFWHRDTWEVTGSVGLHTLDFVYDVDDSADTPAEAEVLGPLPVVGGRWQWRVDGRWYVDAQAQFLALQIGDAKGRLDDARVEISYLIGDNFSLGAGFNHFKSRIEAATDDLDGVLEWHYRGPILSASMHF